MEKEPSVSVVQDWHVIRFQVVNQEVQALIFHTVKAEGGLVLPAAEIPLFLKSLAL